MMGTDMLTVDLTRTFPVPVKKLFELCGSPFFFQLTQADLNTGTMDFRVGGAYAYAFKDQSKLWGAFTEIQPNERIVMTWSSTHPQGPCADTTLTLTFRDLGQESELTLTHSGFDAEAAHQSHAGGWKEIVDALAERFRSSLGAALNSGLEPAFTIQQTFQVPVAPVFSAFIDTKTISTFFVQKTTGPLEPGKQVFWHFDGHDPIAVLCHEVVANERIRFAWGEALVTFAFEDLGERSRLKIRCEGWTPTPEGLADSYAECEGWRHVVLALRVLLEHGITLDAPDCAG